MNRRSRKTNHRLIAAGLTILLVGFAILVFRSGAKQTPTTILESNYDRLGLTKPLALNNTGSQIQGVYSGLNDFSKVHNEVLGQGWKLSGTIFDAAGNPVYSYTKSTDGSALSLVIKQVINSPNDRRTGVLMIVTP